MSKRYLPSDEHHVAVLQQAFFAPSMASDAVRAQVAAKWQESFARINRVEPGISGLMSFSHVRVPPSAPDDYPSFLSRRGLWRQHS